jgi:hypothetical protein
MKADGHYMLLAFNLRPRVLNTTRTTKICIYTKSELTTISTPIHQFFSPPNYIFCGFAKVNNAFEVKKSGQRKKN